ncbi:DNA helicase UvrD [Candidatus Micrarchaeota archaeon CG11_big_fil_rev_8_21_14_0_20_47_5]|nr:MAG: DNA helicase UvrD [Candidatus Micrarchaeota archaeon CG1_02_47_40]PIN84433.1 MAG: DNA helicase UvrD [Candidatus Micrarchaeota archaeon CG11_big_fil_rev_8_21_14_0_20_47_5]
MKLIADLHVHSHYSRATSRDMNLEGMSEWAKLKGINLLGTGDFTHPQWLNELEAKLIPSHDGIYTYNGVNFMLTAEVSNIFNKGGKLRKVHQVLFCPSFEIAKQINEQLAKRGNLLADGRPTFGMEASELVEIVMQISQKNMVIPAHVWTPWFSVFGSNSGFDSIKECYEDMEMHIHALETGLSSDPKMNWRVSALDKYALISNSDAHSPAKLGREANIFDLKELTYGALAQAIKEKDKKKFLCTYEFFPEEGKYHADGHRNCDILLTPKQSKKYGDICPVCKKPLTIGVLHRVEELADREEGYVPKNHIPFESLVPLREIIAKVLKKGEFTAAVHGEYMGLIKYFGSEFAVLHAGEEDLKLATHTRIAEAVILMQKGELSITPGFDGVFGKIEFEKKKVKEEALSQTTLGDF